MSIRDLYEKFLATPAEEILSPDASLHYIPTTTTFMGASNVIQHLIQERHAVKNMGEKILNVVEGIDSLCFELELTLEFVTNGGSYLPALDDNFVVNRRVIFPLIHIAHFDSDSKISQIRIFWDQGALLKQVDIIGPRHYNWPIRDGTEQSRLAISSISMAAKALMKRNIKMQQDSPPKITSDQSPHPPPPPFGLLDGPHSSEAEPVISAALITPQKGDQCQNRSLSTPKVTSRILEHFEFGEAKAPPPSAKYPKTYDHFEFGEAKAPARVEVAKTSRVQNHFEFGEEPPERTKPTKEAIHFELGEASPSSTTSHIPVRPRSSKHESQWDFEDFVTPAKPCQKTRAQDIRHFTWSDEDCEAPDTPKPKPKISRPRRDIEAHFVFEDNGTHKAKQESANNSQGTTSSTYLGLYHNNLYIDTAGNVRPQVESNVLSTVPDLSSRKKDFDSHWDLTDGQSEGEPGKITHLGTGRTRVTQMMDSAWDKYDDDLNNKNNNGGHSRTCAKRRNQNTALPSWGFGDENDI
ncbi:hypothetical protein LOZ12_006735 [Ophidiomyces ophidiicola]|nr:hypothetical protein LOZ64_006752 [Ophidiomyces ophidiicola]KAI1931872.1 hypothetical protein LOZ62_006769 [Ophidiomyces ophidiicola]KAI2029613.1 hypothetical protein LOZ47_006729 [Ophidiomyces ophidiicola]KAI2043230.1 hypothetical protein LOZ38_006732 [Ophidiomyces ophidiicola]KAI2064679.1 hypothetical protein LOZ37_006508 [Ophidiomyces ophidiicola]